MKRKVNMEEEHPQPHGKFERQEPTDVDDFDIVDTPPFQDGVKRSDDCIERSHSGLERCRSDVERQNQSRTRTLWSHSGVERSESGGGRSHSESDVGRSHSQYDETDGGRKLTREGTLRRLSETLLFGEEIKYLNHQLNRYNPQKNTLKELDLFVLDNSLRETTVGQLRGHTLENKWKIYTEIKKVGIKNIILESFNHMTRLGEPFIIDLIKQGEDMSNKYAFSEFVEKMDENRVPTDDVPIGLIKMKTYGIHNVVMELDLVYYNIDYTKFKAGNLCQLLSKRFKWIRENLSPDSRIFVNIRDFSDCMKVNPKRLLYVVHYISKLPERERPFGIAYEDGGKHFPEQLGVWTAIVRKQMNKCGWNDGHLIVHVHKQFGMADVAQLECLANGATGVWAGLCDEGAAIGHASSCLTIMNLIRMGNTKVLNKFNCRKLRDASRAVTKITTGSPPHARQPVCGERALDMVFTLQHLTKDLPNNDFHLHEFLGEEREIRISNMSSASMIVDKLKSKFGWDAQFTEAIAMQMQAKILEDLHDEIKEEYHSDVGLAILFDKSGGHLTEAMMKVIEKVAPQNVHHEKLIAEVRAMWDKWDLRDGVIDDVLDFDAFYNGFMSKYFGCYRCERTRKALQCIDMDNNGNVDWKEFAVYLKWALHQYPDIRSADELIDTAFRRGIIPAMQDEIVNGNVQLEEEATAATSPGYCNIGERSKFYTIQEYAGPDEFLSDVLVVEGQGIINDEKVTLERFSSTFDEDCSEGECPQCKNRMATASPEE